MRLIAQMVGQLDLHRALHQPLGQLRQQPARSGDLLLRASARQQLIDHVARIRGPLDLDRSLARSTASSTSR